MARLVPVRLTVEQILLLASALDSHIYWQLSDQQYRSSGYVLPPASDDPEMRREIRASSRLLARLEDIAFAAAGPQAR
jgi:hypothetical protein